MNIRNMLAGFVLAVFSTFASAAAVNINTASAQELAEAISGIGMKKAQAIVQYRKSSGGFKTVNDLTNIKGIGQKLLEKNRKNITLEE